MNPEYMCEVVKVKTPVTTDNPEGAVIINKSDFVEGEHELFDAPAKTVTPAPLPTGGKPWTPAT